MTTLPDTSETEETLIEPTADISVEPVIVTKPSEVNVPAADIVDCANVSTPGVADRAETPDIDAWALDVTCPTAPAEPAADIDDWP